MFTPFRLIDVFPHTHPWMRAKPRDERAQLFFPRTRLFVEAAQLAKVDKTMHLVPRRGVLVSLLQLEGIAIP